MLYSYSWDSAAHKAWVLKLGEELHKHGVFVHLDQWDVKLGSDIPQYMESSIRESGFVLLVCTPAFAEKANTGKGGVGYEKSIVTGEIFLSNQRTTKFIPVLRVGDPFTSIPSYLQSKAFVDFRNNEDFEASLEQLLRHIHDVPLVSRPPLGSKPKFEKSQSVPNGSSVLEQNAAKNPVRRFDTDLFTQLRDFAYSSTGLDMARDPAREWALLHLNDQPPFSPERFRELKDFAYSSNGLDMAHDKAREWALQHLNDQPPFNPERFRELYDFAYSSTGLDMARDRAREWTLSKMREDD